MILNPRIAPHGKALVITLESRKGSMPEGKVAAGSWQPLSRAIKTLCARFASEGAEDEATFGDASVPPMQLNTPASGLISRQADDGSLTIASLYPRELETGEPVPVFLSIPVAMRLAEFMGRMATGAPPPRQRTRRAPGAEAP